MKSGILRIIDVNLNRSREGLRVCEDIARLALGSPRLTRELKDARHDISCVAKARVYSRQCPIKARDAGRDIGRRLKTRSEMKRSGLIDIFEANIERVKESLRVLEELFKLVDKRASVKFSALRFRIYDIEKKAVKRAWAVRNTRL